MFVQQAPDLPCNGDSCEGVGPDITTWWKTRSWWIFKKSMKHGAWKMWTNTFCANGPMNKTSHCTVHRNFCGRKEHLKLNLHSTNTLSPTQCKPDELWPGSWILSHPEKNATIKPQKSPGETNQPTLTPPLTGWSSKTRCEGSEPFFKFAQQVIQVTNTTRSHYKNYFRATFNVLRWWRSFGFAGGFWWLNGFLVPLVGLAECTLKALQTQLRPGSWLPNDILSLRTSIHISHGPHELSSGTVEAVSLPQLETALSNLCIVYNLCIFFKWKNKNIRYNDWAYRPQRLPVA